MLPPLRLPGNTNRMDDDTADQGIARMDDRLERHARAGLRSDAGLACLAVAVIVLEVTVRPPVRRWDLLVAAAAVALLAAGGFMRGLMLRSYQSEVRDLRRRS